MIGRASLAHDSGEIAVIRAAIVITATTPPNHRVTVVESIAWKKVESSNLHISRSAWPRTPITSSVQKLEVKDMSF